MKKETRIKILSALVFIVNLVALVYVKINYGEQVFNVGCIVAALVTFWLGRKYFTGGAL
ncbi:MAG TPA: hypothetical protein VJB09_02800 [Candidatus Paceibacterota bacterium]